MAASSESDDSRSESESEVEEPKLKYTRLAASATEILKKDAASCMVAHDKFLVLGTHMGVVYVLDFSGNEIRRFSAHNSAVHELSVDRAGEYIASCSDDGKVVVCSLCSEKSIPIAYNLNKPLTAVSIHPEYEKTLEFVCGGPSGEIFLNTKGWFSDYQELIQAGEGAIHSISWHPQDSLIAFGIDIGVRIYDRAIKERLGFVERPRHTTSPDLYRCCLCWEGQDQLVIGWGNYVQIVKITNRPINKPSSPLKCVHVTMEFATEFLLSGIALYEHNFLILAHSKQEEKSNVEGGVRPELHIITRANEEVSCDALGIIGFEKFIAKDYRLCYIHSEELYYVVSPKDIVIVQPRDIKDHIQWLLLYQKYYQIITIIEGREKEFQNIPGISDIGKLYIKSLVDNGKFEEAASEAKKYLKYNESAWKDIVSSFIKAKQLLLLLPHIPTENPTLPSDVYIEVLKHLLNSKEYSTLLDLISVWSSVYVPQDFATAIKSKLQSNTNNNDIQQLNQLLQKLNLS